MIVKYDCARKQAAFRGFLELNGISILSKDPDGALLFQVGPVHCRISAAQAVELSRLPEDEIVEWFRQEVGA